MGAAFLCDRCDETFEGTPEVVMHKDDVERDHRFEGYLGDALCEDCVAMYDEFMDGCEVVKTEDESDGMIGFITDDSYRTPGVTGLTMTFKPSEPNYNQNTSSSLPSLPDYMEQPGANY